MDSLIQNLRYTVRKLLRAPLLSGVAVLTLLVGAIRHFRYMLALGWVLHLDWDTLLHTGLGTDFVSLCYVPLCVGFDRVVAGGILKGSLPLRD